MKLAIYALAGALLVSGCSLQTEKKASDAVSGFVLSRAKMDSYQPPAGSPCTPADAISKVTVYAGGKGTTTAPIEPTGTIQWPSDPPRPGTQQCRRSFSGSTYPDASDYQVALDGMRGAPTVGETNLTNLALVVVDGAIIYAGPPD